MFSSFKISSLNKRLPIIDVNNSGDDDPAAMNVAPATSSSRFNLYKGKKVNLILS